MADSEGVSFFVPKALATQLGIGEGQTFAQEETEALRAKANHHLCKAKIYDYLSRRDHSRREVEQKLRLKGFDSATYDNLLDAFEEQGLLDDQRFAENLVRRRLRTNPEGPGMLKQRLYAKGIDRKIIATVLDNLLNDEVIWEACCTVGDKLSRRKEGNKLRDAMLRKGFRWDMVRAYLNDESRD